MNDLPNNLISFAEFELDTVHRKLLRDGETVALHGKAFDLLTYLIENNGRIVTKEEVLDVVWEGSFVEESNLVVQISNLRKVLGESKNSPRFLVTVPGKGYKFVADIDENDLIIETHSVAELTIEQEEIVSQWHPLPAKSSANWKWLGLAAVSLLAILTIGGIIFWFQPSGQAKTAAFGWANPSRPIQQRQLTATGQVEVAAISPDGTLYAYTIEGSELSGLWVSGINGSQTVEVLPLSAIDFQGLTFSRDGSNIYYTARDKKNPQGALFRVPTLGGLSEKILTDICCPITFSPDGQQFAFMRTDSQSKLTSMIIASAIGEPKEKILLTRPANAGFNGFGASWSPDGTKIAVGVKEEQTGKNIVLLIDVKTGKEEKFGEKPWNRVRRVTWLPDGSGLLVNVIEKEFWQQRQLWLLDYPGGQAHKITNDLNRYGQESIAVSNDGTKILAVQAQTISNIFVGNADNPKELSKITQNALGKSDGAYHSLTWTPDGGLVFMRFFDKSDTLWTMNADGSNAKQLTPSGSLDRKPVVTSDGRFVVFQSIRSGFWNVWRIGLDGSELKQLTFNDIGSERDYSPPSLTPDGKWIFYHQNGFIWKISINGGTPVQMTNKPSKAVEVSPDGKMFACFYRFTKEDKLKLAVFPIDGGEPLYLFDVKADLPFEKLRWTPDSQSLVYNFYNSTAWKQNLSGGEAEKFLDFSGEVINAFSWSFDGKQFAVAYGQEPRDVVLFTIER